MSKYGIIYLQYQLYIERFVKDVITNTHWHEITKQDLIIVQKQIVAKATYKKLDGRFVQKRGLITID